MFQQMKSRSKSCECCHSRYANWYQELPLEEKIAHHNKRDKRALLIWGLLATFTFTSSIFLIVSHYYVQPHLNAVDKIAWQATDRLALFIGFMPPMAIGTLLFLYDLAKIAWRKKFGDKRDFSKPPAPL